MSVAQRPRKQASAATATPVELSIVMPCLNEAETLATCIHKAQRATKQLDVAAEIIVADNGSTDGSQAIARELGARVVSVARKGYGSALIGKLREGFDLVMGNRFAGGIESGAMVWSHRWVGNPALTCISRVFFHTP